MSSSIIENEGSMQDGYLRILENSHLIVLMNTVSAGLNVSMNFFLVQVKPTWFGRPPGVRWSAILKAEWLDTGFVPHV